MVSLNDSHDVRARYFELQRRRLAFIDLVSQWAGAPERPQARDVRRLVISYLRVTEESARAQAALEFKPKSPPRPASRGPR